MNSAEMWCEGCVVDQTSNRYSLHKHLSPPLQQQLLAFTHSDPLIAQQTSDRERFASEQKLGQWLTGDRLTFALTPEYQPEELVGLFWFSHEPFPLETNDRRAQNSQWTLGIRLYEMARGKRLSMPFMTASFEHFWGLHPGESVWLSTGKTNLVSQKIYTQFGFEKIATKAEKVFYLICV